MKTNRKPAGRQFLTKKAARLLPNALLFSNTLDPEKQTPRFQMMMESVRRMGKTATLLSVQSSDTVAIKNILANDSNVAIYIAGNCGSEDAELLEKLGKLSIEDIKRAYIYDEKLPECIRLARAIRITAGERKLSISIIVTKASKKLVDAGMSVGFHVAPGLNRRQPTVAEAMKVLNDILKYANKLEKECEKSVKYKRLCKTTQTLTRILAKIIKRETGMSLAGA